MRTASRSRGFTLIELSIVLVILGLLAGGIIVGQSLIHGSALQAILKERTTYFTAVGSFRDKFHTVPGDLPNAFMYWGATCGANDSTTTGCNGNGDGQISYVGGEPAKALQHLIMANLIEGAALNLAGSTDDGSSHIYITFDNTLPSKFDQGAWSMSNDTLTYAGASQAVDYLAFGSVGSTAKTLVAASSLSLGEAYSIDRKIDDGRANVGGVRGWTTACVDTGSDYYSLISRGENVTNICRLTFLLQ